MCVIYVFRYFCNTNSIDFDFKLLIRITFIFLRMYVIIQNSKFVQINFIHFSISGHGRFIYIENKSTIHLIANHVNSKQKRIFLTESHFIFFLWESLVRPYFYDLIFLRTYLNTNYFIAICCYYVRRR